MDDLKDKAAMFLEAEFNISGDHMVDMDHDLDDIPLMQRGSFNLFDIMVAFVESERGQKDNTGEGQLNIPVVSGSLPTVKQVKEKCEKDIAGFLDNNTEKELQHYRVAHRRSFEFVQRFIGNDR